VRFTHRIKKRFQWHAYDTNTSHVLCRRLGNGRTKPKLKSRDCVPEGLWIRGAMDKITLYCTLGSKQVPNDTKSRQYSKKFQTPRKVPSLGYQRSNRNKCLIVLPLIKTMIAISTRGYESGMSAFCSVAKGLVVCFSRVRESWARKS